MPPKSKKFIESTKPKWEKNLYSNQGYPDNYTDESFLKDLKTNINLKHYTYLEAIQGATFLSNQISCVTCFLFNFYFMNSGELSPSKALLFNGTVTLVCYIAYKIRNLSINDLMESSKTLLTVLVFGYIFSPLLHTLTDAISTDTIYSMTFFVMFLNIAFHDYGLESAFTVFLVPCICSFGIAAVYFVLYPIFSRRFWKSYLLIPLSGGVCYYLSEISVPLLYTYVAVVVFINILCPILFVRLQRHKNNIYGPWDEAVVDIGDKKSK
uniref:Phosphatidylinositol N-acetylglucosaminyltransferase n=1 Tax=Megaselia scalaris TaxID=36166 RepID=T1H0F7_MEGSC